MTFTKLNLDSRIMKALEDANYEIPTDIQNQAIPSVLADRDLFGSAQTGTGKTAAFALPIIHQLLNQPVNEPKKIKALVLTPTRELAIQVRDNFRKYSIHTNLKCSVIFGGVNQQSQIKVLKAGVDVVVATPGRLLDLINQKYAKLDNVTHLVLDEADVMLDMGFIHDVKKIISHIPKERQTLLFSATMPDAIKDLSASLLKKPITIAAHPTSSTVDKISQSLYYVDKHNKTSLLIDILKDPSIKSALVFARTKHGANKLSEKLNNSGIKSDVIHGNKSQGARVNALNNFKTGQVKVLVATDIAARGIDISGLSHVINYEMPEQAETYVHRIGRTGRASFSGTAISLCNINEKPLVTSIEKLIKISIPVVIDHNYPMINLTPTPKGGAFKQSNFRMDNRKSNGFNRQNQRNNNSFKQKSFNAGKRNR